MNQLSQIDPSMNGQNYTSTPLEIEAILNDPIWPRLVPVLNEGKQILSSEIIKAITAPVTSLPIPKGWLEARAIAGAKPEEVRGELAKQWDADGQRQTRQSAVVGAQKAVEILISFSGTQAHRQLSDRAEDHSHEPVAASPAAHWFGNSWRGALLVGVLYASISNGKKLVLLSRHRLFNTPEDALLLSAIFSIAPVVIYEWVAHQVSGKTRRRLDRALQVAAVPSVIAGLATFALSFGSTTEGPIAAILTGVVPSGPHWGLVILANLIVEMFAEIALWSSLRRAPAPSNSKVAMSEKELESKVPPKQFESNEVLLAELEALDTRLTEIFSGLRREQEAWINNGIGHFEAKKTAVAAAEDLARACARDRIANAALAAQ